jgi:hypothetical protein
MDQGTKEDAVRLQGQPHLHVQQERLLNPINGDFQDCSEKLSPTVALVLSRVQGSWI